MSELTITEAGVSKTQLRPGMSSNNERLNQMKTKVFTITPDTHTEAAAVNESVFQADELANFMSEKGGTAIIQSIVILDDDDNGGAMDLIFYDTVSGTPSTDFGTEGSAITVDDDSSSIPGSILGVIRVSDYMDGINWQLGHKENCGLVLKAASGSTSIYVAAVNRSGGALTWTASGLHFKFGVVKD